MPVTTCGQTTVLTGQDGMITMKPPGTTVCLLDKTDFPAPVTPATFSLIKVPANSDFRVNDPVVFTEKGTASLDASITQGTVYYIKTRPSATTVSISATVGGSAIALAGDGGAGGADTPGAGNHVEMTFATSQAMCEVPSVTFSITRGEIDVTAIPCTPGSVGGPKIARFRRTQPGFASGTGTLTLRLVEDLTAFNNRILQGVLFNNQVGAMLSVYLNAVSASGGSAIDNSQSLRTEFPVTLNGLDGGISQEDTPTEISVNFSISDQPTHVFGLDTP